MAESPLTKTPADDDPNDTAAFERPSTLPSDSLGVRSDVTTDFDQDSHPSASSPGLAPAAKPLTQTQIGGYRLEKLLGEGGMGRVYKGLDGQGRAVAVKLLSARWATSGEALQRFKQEGYIASQINHPHCVFVHRVDEDRGTPFIAMELMTGKTLKDLVVERGTLPFREAVQLILQCIDGLIEAHRQGMIHRDIKPANCYLDDSGSVKIGDFGLARSLVDDSELTRTGAFMGTPLFASPEQLLGQALDERSDIYSLSATLYYLLAGRAPFESPNAAQVIAKIASSDPPTFAEVGVKVPPVLEAIVMRGLTRDRNKRFENFQQLRAALLPIVNTDSDLAPFPRRAMAGFIDSVTVGCVLTFGMILAAAMGMSELRALREWFPLLGSLTTSILLFVYFSSQEWLLGCSLGKRLMRLQVVDAETGGRIRLRQALLRAGLFVLICNGTELTYHAVASEDLATAPVVAWISELIGWSVLLTGWWLTGRKQLTHEYFSGTLTKLTVQRRTAGHVQLTLPDCPVAYKPLTVPRAIGRFKLSSQLQTADQSMWFVAHDEGLDREVWINLLPSGAPPLSEERKSCTRRTRMRVIESGIDGGQTWDAYLAPDGVPLSACITGGTVLPWPLARQLLQQLIDEYNHDSSALSENGWNANRIWLDAGGRATICEPLLTPIEDSPKTGISRLLSDVAWAALPLRHPMRRKRAAELGQPSTTAGTAKQLLPVADLPPYRGLRFLECLVQGRYQLSQLSSELTRIDQTNEQVTPAVKLAHTLTVGIATLPLMATIWVLMSVNSIVVINQLHEDSRKLTTLASVLEAPEKYPLAFKNGPAELQPDAIKPEVIQSVRSNALRAHLESRRAYDTLNLFERYILAQAELTEETFQQPPEPYFIVRGEKADPQPTAKPKLRIRDEDNGIDIQASGLDDDREMEKNVLRKYYPIHQAWLKSPFGSEKDLSIGPFTVGFFATLWIWTVISGGGVLPVFTGVACVRRDGCRVGRLRIAWRALIVLLPFALLAWLGIYLELQNPGWMTITSHFKTAYAVLPIAYLICAVLWPQIGPHDRLSYTAAVPR